MKQRNLCGLLPFLLLAVFLVFCGGGKTFRNNKWEVTLHSAGYQKDFKYQSYEYPSGMKEKSMEGLVVVFTCGYIGPEGLSLPPEISLRRVSDRMKIDLIVWLLKEICG